MASLTSLDGLTFGVNNNAPVGAVGTPNFTQPDGTVALGGVIQIEDNGFGFFSTGDLGGNDAYQIENVDLSAATSYRFGTLVVNDLATGTSVTGDIIGVNSTGVLIGVTDPANPYNPNATGGAFYSDGYEFISNTDISELQQNPPNPTPPKFPIVLSGAPSAANDYNPPCFARGTRIATPTGFALVEDLQVGDIVLTISGAHRPVTWTGLRDVDVARHPSPELVRPIRIAAGAFAENEPSRDLLVSPDHNVFTGGVLIPAKCLVNGASVVQIDVPSVTYHHVELASHDVVLAEGLPTETYLDTGNRTSFAGEGVVVAHPDFASAPDVNFFAWEAKGYARLVLEGPEIARVRAQLAQRIERDTAKAGNVRAA